MISLLRQVKTLAMSHDDHDNSIIHHAAMNKSSNFFGAVMSGIEMVVTTQEVRDKRRFGIHPSHDQGADASFTSSRCRS